MYYSGLCVVTLAGFSTCLPPHFCFFKGPPVMLLFFTQNFKLFGSPWLNAIGRTWLDSLNIALRNIIIYIQRVGHYFSHDIC